MKFIKVILLLILSFGMLLACNNAEHTETKSTETHEILKADTVNEQVLVSKNWQCVQLKSNENIGDLESDVTVIENTKAKVEVKNIQLLKSFSYGFILDNELHVNNNVAEYNFTISDKKTHFGLSYLLDSEGLVIKNPETINTFFVAKDSKIKVKNSVDTEPALFLNLPNSAKANPRVIIDFVLLNTNIAKGARYVKLNIDGEEINIHNWSGYEIKGLQSGKHTLKLSLCEANGKLVKGSFTEVEKEFEVK